MTGFINAAAVALRAAAKLGLELFNATRSVNETFFTGECGMRVSRDVANDNLMLDAINRFGFATTHGRAG
jgi:hypothetical protein